MNAGAVDLAPDSGGYGSRIKSGITGMKRVSRRLSARLERLFEAERAQLPLWLPVGLMLGIGAWFWLPDRPQWAAFLLLAAGLGLLFVALAPGTRWGRALAIFGLAATLGCGLTWWKAEQAAAPRIERDGLLSGDALIESVQTLAAEEAVRLVVRRSARGRCGCAGNVADDKVVPGLVPGATVRLRAWMMPPAPMAVPGGYDFARTAWFQQIGGTGRALDIAVVVPASSQSFSATIAGWRQRLSAHIRERLSGGGEAGIAAALATGDQYGIPEADAEAMRRSGLAHLLSVSGLHQTAGVGAVRLLS